MAIPSIGPKIAESIYTFCHIESNREIIRRLKEAGVKMEEEAKAAGEQPLAGKEFVITGRLEKYSREEAQSRIEARGGITKDNVTKIPTLWWRGQTPGPSSPVPVSWGKR